MQQLKGKKIWTPEEDELIKCLVKGESEPNWKLVSEKVNKLKLARKTPKQCRERFRNYLEREDMDPSWSNGEKLLFAILYSEIGNKWMTLCRYIPKKTDISIKNYHYQIIRKAVRYLCESSLEEARQDRLQELFCLFSTLELIKSRYFRGVERKSSANREDNEKMVLKILKARKVTKEGITMYEELLKKTVLSEKSAAQPPFLIQVESEDLKFPHDVMLELMNILNKRSNQIVDEIFMVKILKPTIIPNSIPSEFPFHERIAGPSKNPENLSGPIPCPVNNQCQRSLPPLSTLNFPLPSQLEYQVLLPDPSIQFINNSEAFQKSIQYSHSQYNFSQFFNLGPNIFWNRMRPILPPPRKFVPSSAPYLFTKVSPPFSH